MPDIHAINLHLQERLEREWRDEVAAAEAATWLDQAGLLRNSKNGLPLRSLLRAGRIAGQEQRPNQRNGRWWIRRLAASRTPREIQRARQQIQRHLPIDRRALADDWPLSQGYLAFWEELGKTIAALGYLEIALTEACYGLLATPEKARNAMAAGDDAVSRWFTRIEKSRTDGLGALAREFARTLKEDGKVPHGVREDLVERLSELRPWRNALCHGAWLAFREDGSGELRHYYKFEGVPVAFPPEVTLEDLREIRAKAVDATIRLAEAASIVDGGTALTPLPLNDARRQRSPG